MENLDPSIRNAARALIVRDDHILLLRKQGGGRGERFALPGGAQDPGETLQDALNRECLEEIDTRVQIHDLVGVADYFKPRDTRPPSTRHVVEFLFECTVPGDYTPHNGYRPDKHQVEVAWVGLAALGNMALQPGSLAGVIGGIRAGNQRVYLGTVD
jgi:ADP-ribose pyrophosphatase YjhB (NUDIX family)